MSSSNAASDSVNWDGGPMPGMLAPSQDPCSLMLDDQFMVNSYKVETCMLTHPHGWKVCPYVHPGEPVKRRHPSTHRGDMCPAVKKGLHCQVGQDDCPYAHNSFELWLHPSRYKTKMCRKGAACPRGICFFAHCESELRQRPVNPNNQPCNKAHQATATQQLATSSGATTAGTAATAVALPVTLPVSAPWTVLPNLPAPAAAITVPGTSPAVSAATAATAAPGPLATLPQASDAQLLLLQRQLELLKMQHEHEMQCLQEKMLLMQLMQQQDQQQHATATAFSQVSTSPVLGAFNYASLGCAHTSSMLAPTALPVMDPIAAVRATAASTATALLGSHTSISSDSVSPLQPGQAMQPQQVPNCALTAADMFYGSSCSSSSSSGSSSSTPRQGSSTGCCSQAMTGSPAQNAMCAKWSAQSLGGVSMWNAPKSMYGMS